MKKVFSGIQPTGGIHIGNYLGALKKWVELQKDYDCIYCIVDLHAITTYQDPVELRKNVRDTANILIATGIDLEKSSLFVQSYLPQHTELTWLLNTITTFGELKRMTQFKEKGGDQESVGAGLFDYPILMAADILLYQTDMVPVGEDQKQHLELTRDIAIRFNNKYGHTFKVPEALIGEMGARIMGLDNPEKKMSKSASSEYNYISLTDSPDLIIRKISRAVTDSGQEIKSKTEKPAISNLLTIFSLFSDKSIKKLEDEYQGKGYSDFKKDLAELVVEKISPIQKEIKELEENPDFVDKLLIESAARIEPIAESTLNKAKERMGLI